MIRREIRSHVRANLLIDESSPLFAWQGPSEELALDTAGDDTAQATDCYFAEQVGDLVAGQLTYCYPKIYKVKAVYMLDSTGVRHQLVRDKSAFGSLVPRSVQMSTLNNFTVDPVPTVTTTSGLIVAGFAVPSLPKAGHERHQWDTDDDACPLPEWAHNAVVLKATALRARQLAAKDRTMLGLMQQYESDWRAACGELEAQATRAYRDRNKR